jgi:hypothetical protein
MAKNLCGKTRPITDPYETWSDGTGWHWHVLKKYSANDDAPYVRWFCFVTSPYCPDGEYGDTYVEEIKRYARRVLSSQERAQLNGDPL